MNNSSASAEVYRQTWITDRAWVSGLAGALAVIFIACWYAETSALNSGARFASWQLTQSRHGSILLALALVAGIMVFAEWIRLIFCVRDGGVLKIHPLVRSRSWHAFVFESLCHFGTYLLLIKLVILFFQTAGEYGFARQANYYQGWFLLLEWVWLGYLWCGLPYVLATRGLQYSVEADDKDIASIVLRMASGLFPGKHKTKGPVARSLVRKNLRALLVKLFFAPLMTVFFIDQFPHLVNNIHYVLNGLPEAFASGRYNHFRLNNDLFNISVALIFSIDVALAWCGYMTASRWVGNQTVSAEPTMLGWVVCLICYPPFQMFLGLYYAAPAERDILRFTSPYWVTLFAVLMIASYSVYMWTTLCFGVRFSNLTHRGIIRSGPFRYVRHPAYASKNFAWWCIMFPVILYNMKNSGLSTGIAQIFGLLLMTWVYYWRAVTEERHLAFDPAYQAYCLKVRYRFIPRLI